LPDHYDGYAISKAELWWEERTDEFFPDTVDEFLFLSGQLAEPIEIEVVKDGRFDRITGYKFYEDDSSPGDFFEENFIETEPMTDDVPF